MKGKAKVYSEGAFRPREVVYLGIDASYTGFGFAVLGAEAYRILVYESQGSGVDRLLDIQRWLSSTLEAIDPHAVGDSALEGYSMASRYGREMAGELGGMVRMTIRTHPATTLTAARYPMIVSPQGLKKYVLGPGKGTGKSLMLKGVYQRWGLDVDDDNAADAYALARIASKEAEFKYQQEVLAKARESRPWIG